MKKLICALLAAATLFCLTGCGQYVKYDESGYFTAPDGSFKIEYTENFKQQKETGDSYIIVEWKKKELSLQACRISKSLDVISANNVQTLDEFIDLYRKQALSFLEVNSTFDELKDAEGFDQFLAAKMQDVQTKERADTIESFLVYAETDTDFYVIYSNGDEMSFLNNYDAMLDMAKSIVVK
ncbi:MAG: hypothetical protein IIX77_04860 [Oscillospiraceae bacterium]|nr:hypothetical protein [Oscillospiraceae bacterium]